MAVTRMSWRLVCWWPPAWRWCWAGAVDTARPARTAAAPAAPLEDSVLMPNGAGIETEEKVDAVMSCRYDKFLSAKTPKAILKDTKNKGGSDKGMRVVLNFTGSHNFLQCSKSDAGVHLSVVTCKDEESQSLRKICHLSSS
ncbi:hypothetical protein AALO_G00287330 [Alosa alosa]|uniref:Uncharacterized protein n=1 Tax=Alosa alosa TaxID=278164 RepID=A0AAV6FKM8_9TELE|nr:hypothetical protein AALO_G00287330 [Alosa alosa]